MLWAGVKYKMEEGRYGCARVGVSERVGVNASASGNGCGVEDEWSQENKTKKECCCLCVQFVSAAMHGEGNVDWRGGSSQVLRTMWCKNGPREEGRRGERDKDGQWV